MWHGCAREVTVKPTWTVNWGIHHNTNPNPVNLFVQCVRGIRHNGDVDATQHCVPDNSSAIYVTTSVSFLTGRMRWLTWVKDADKRFIFMNYLWTMQNIMFTALTTCSTLTLHLACYAVQTDSCVSHRVTHGTDATEIKCVFFWSR